MSCLPWSLRSSTKSPIIHPISQQDSPQLLNATPTFQYLSDLHLEKTLYTPLPTPFPIPRLAPNLILAGDILNLADTPSYLPFLRNLCKIFDRVFLIPGNHEYFHLDRRQDAPALIAQLCAELGERFVWMDRGRADIDGGRTILLGCTLHSYIPKPAVPAVQKQIQDFARIGSWGIAEHNAEHERDRKWLKSQLREIRRSHPAARVVIATHFPPMWEGTSDPMFDEKPTRSFFGSGVLEEFWGWRGSGQVRHWIFGHTHWNVRLRAGGLVLVSNQYHHGRAGDDEEFRVDAVI